MRAMSVFILSAYIAPVFILGTDSPVLIHDYLDSAVSWFSVLRESSLGWLVLGETVPGIMIDLPRDALPSELSFLTIIFMFLPPYAAHAINFAAIHIIAFIGMRRMILVSSIAEGRPVLTYGGPLIFSLLPFAPYLGATVAGIPLAISALLSFRERMQTRYDWAILFVMPFYSSLVVGFMFLYFLFSILVIIDLKKGRDVRWQIISLAVMSILHIISNYRLLYLTYGPDGFVGHRDGREFASEVPVTDSIIASVDLAGRHFITGHYHAASEHSTFIGIGIMAALVLTISRHGMVQSSRFQITSSMLCAIVVLCSLIGYLLGWDQVKILLWFGIMSCWFICALFFLRGYKDDFDGNGFNNSEISIMTLILMLIIFSSWAGAWGHLSPLQEMKNSFSLLRGVDFGRFFFISPTIWVLTFTISLEKILEWGEGNSESGEGRATLSVIVIVALLMAQISHLMLLDDDDDLLQNAGIGALLSEDMTFDEFYSNDLFSEISIHLNEQVTDPKVISVGIHPSIASFNGIWTLDQYLVMYDSEYKSLFRGIIEEELNKNIEIMEYYDNWGNRCYVISSELWIRNSGGWQFMNTKDSQANYPISLAINTSNMAEMGGTHVLSAVEIWNYDQLGLSAPDVFESESSPWKINVYQII